MKIDSMSGRSSDAGIGLRPAMPGQVSTRRVRWIAVVVGAAALSMGAAALGQAAPVPCSAPEHRAFDFWAGEWNVHGPGGKFAGTNRVQREYGGCVLHERYDTGRGYSGESLNIYDEGRKVWHQSWVDSSGLLLLLEGGLRNDSMVLEGQTTGADGKVARHRITWTPNADGSVRQLWETAAPGEPWAVAFDGRYTRR